MPDLNIVSPVEWQRRTAVRIGGRGARLEAVDAAYEVYYLDRTEGKAAQLASALETYLVAHGSKWAHVTRNTRSGGLMEYVFNAARKHASGAMIGATNPAKAALDAAAVDARLGVLHLFAYTDVATQHFAVLLEGTLKVAGAASGFIPKAIPLVTHGTAIYSATDAIAPGAKVAAKLVNKHLMATPARGADLRSMAPEQIQRERRGAVSVTPAPLAVPPAVMALAPLGNIMASSVISGGGALFDAALSAGAWSREKLFQLSEYLSEFANWVIAKIKTNERTVWSIAGTAVQEIVKAAIGYICKAALPFLGPAMNIANGVAQMVSAAKTRIEAALLRRHFVIQAGHPERLASSIESAMNWAIGTGLWTSLKGAVSLGATFASAGASVLANVIAAALEFVTKTIMRLREAHQMTLALELAQKAYWGCTEKFTDPDSGAPRIRAKPGSLVTKRDEFTELYELMCEASPCIAMLTLNSGICGDLMQMMKMFDDTTAARDIGQSEFNAGADYFASLKGFGRSYMEKSGFRFTSKNETVNGYLRHALQHHNPITISTGDAVLAIMGA